MSQINGKFSVPQVCALLVVAAGDSSLLEKLWRKCPRRTNTEIGKSVVRSVGNPHLKLSKPKQSMSHQAKRQPPAARSFVRNHRHRLLHDNIFMSVRVVLEWNSTIRTTENLIILRHNREAKCMAFVEFVWCGEEEKAPLLMLSETTWHWYFGRRFRMIWWWRLTLERRWL